MYFTSYFCQILKKLKFSRRFFEKSSKTISSTCSLRKGRQTDGQTGMTNLIFAFRSLRTRYKFFTLVHCSIERSTYRATRTGAWRIKIVIFVTHDIEVSNDIGAETWRFRDARQSQIISHTASHTLHGVIRRTALLSSDLTVTEHTKNLACVTVQLVPPLFAIQTPICFNKCSNVSKWNALWLYRQSQWRCHNCSCGKTAVWNLMRFCTARGAVHVKGHRSAF
jgi:hypothetical protein